MKSAFPFAISSALTLLLSSVQLSTSQYHSPSVNAAPTVDVGALFQHTTSRNQKVITQAVDFVVSMQTAPTCTRMAASHLMNECKLLENAPDFAKARPEAYLDKVKTEYAAKLAVCELLSAQPHNPTPPPNCEMLVPTSKACGRGGTWWYSQPETSKNDKQCYPEIKEYQYAQCLKTLQSLPQYWTSFSNARQNAVVMCQASRDAIERENHLETFKNLTHVMGAVSSAMKESTEEHEALIKDQKQFAYKVQKAQDRFKKDVHAVQEKAIATVSTLNNKFHSFMETSMSDLVTALADSQSNEIAMIRQQMQAFLGDLMAESSQFAKFYNNQLEVHHEQALGSLQANHKAQTDSHNVLSGQISAIQDIANMSNIAVNTTLENIIRIEERMSRISDKTDDIAQVFAFFEALPQLLSSLFRGIVATIGIAFLFSVLSKINKRLAKDAAGIGSLLYFFHLCGLYQWLGNLPVLAAILHQHQGVSITANLSSTQKAAALIMLLWLSAYPVRYINFYLGSMISAIVSKTLGSYWLQNYSNDGGYGLLPSIEVPASTASHKADHLDNAFLSSDPLAHAPRSFSPVDA
ncbi:hypothetical protein HBI18_253470 [Parastagonospora nodorum]|nr:hypothetical protein HBI18_253470 [Parastagonospora nodorum]